MYAMKQVFSLSAISLCVGLLAACTTNGATRIIQAAETETLSQSTYAWANDSFVQDPPRGFSASRLNALENALTAAMSDKGYTLVEDGEPADLIVTVDVEYDTSGSAVLTTPIYQLDERRERREEDNISTVRVVRVDQHPVETSAAQTSRNNRAITSARAGASPYNPNAHVEGVIFIGVLEGETAVQLWQGSVTKVILLYELETFEREIADDITRLFASFPPSEAN